MRRFAGWTLLVVAALVSGALSAWPLIRGVVERTAIHNGPWRTSVGTGAANAGLHERAAIAVAGLYALAKEETVYYTAYVDNQGRALDGRCDYRVEGIPPPARWWSLTLYGADDYLVANTAGIYSRHASNLDLTADGRFVIAVAAEYQPYNWLPAPAAGTYSLTLRLYNPGPDVYAQLDTVALPDIARGDCR